MQICEEKEKKKKKWDNHKIYNCWQLPPLDVMLTNHGAYHVQLTFLFVTLEVADPRKTSSCLTNTALIDSIIYQLSHWVILSLTIFNRPGVAGAVLQTPLSFIHSLINSLIKVSDGLWKYIQSTVNLKPEELEG